LVASQTAILERIVKWTSPDDAGKYLGKSGGSIPSTVHDVDCKGLTSYSGPPATAERENRRFAASGVTVPITDRGKVAWN
jgi:hypothetical protein